MMDPRVCLQLHDGSQEVFNTPVCIQGSIYYFVMDPREYYYSVMDPGSIYYSTMYPREHLLLRDGSHGVFTIPW